MRGIPKGLIYAASFTNIYIRITAEFVGWQMGGQCVAATQAFGRSSSVFLCKELPVFLLGHFQQPFWI